RAALARALISDPELLILDEPLDGLEPRHQGEFREDIRRIHAVRETTTLILSHDPRESLALADRLAVMDLGKVVQSGRPGEIYNRPADSFVAQFLGPSNLIQGHLEGSESRGEVVVKTPLGRLVGQAPPDPLPGGTPVMVAIRPESLSLGPTVPPRANRFAATLERQVFLGELREIHLRGPNDWPVTALALQSQSGGLREGQSLTVSVPSEFVIVLPSRFATAR